VHVTITSFHKNVHANKTYLLDVNPPETIETPKLKILENTLHSTIRDRFSASPRAPFPKANEANLPRPVP